jgi:hypothetical protein
MPSRYLNTEAPQSGLDALVSGAAQAYTGIRDERRKRQEEAQKDALLRQQMQNADMEQQRANISAGVSVQQGTRPDPIQQGQAQAQGVRAKIGSILGGLFKSNAPALEPTPTLVKTGPSQQERVAQIGEEGANSRNAATIASENARNAANITSTDSRSAAALGEETRWHDLEHTDRLAQIAAIRDKDVRDGRREDARDLRDYGRQLNEEAASIQRMIADKNGIMQQIGNSADPVAAYQQRQRELHERLGQLHQQLNDVNAQMSRKAIGQQLRGKPAQTTPAGVPSRQPSLQEDLQAAMRPGTR